MRADSSARLNSNAHWPPIRSDQSTPSHENRFPTILPAQRNRRYPRRLRQQSQNRRGEGRTRPRQGRRSGIHRLRTTDRSQRHDRIRQRKRASRSRPAASSPNCSSTKAKPSARGQLLARLNLTEIDAQVGQARNAFEKAERDFKRVSNLYRDSAATLEQFQNAQTGFQLAEQALQIAGFNQRYSSIYATESGRVLRKLMNEGELVGPGQPVYVINSTRPGDWVIRIGVADRDWAASRCATRPRSGSTPSRRHAQSRSERDRRKPPTRSPAPSPSNSASRPANVASRADSSPHPPAPRAQGETRTSYPSKPSPPPTATRPRSSACATTARPSKPAPSGGPHPSRPRGRPRRRRILRTVVTDGASYLHDGETVTVLR